MALEHIERRARRIRELRVSGGLSQEGLADRMQEVHHGLHPEAPPDQTRGQMVSDWERAVNEPSPKKLELLAAALGVTVADLSVDQPDKSRTPDPLDRRSSPSIELLLTRLEGIALRLDIIGIRGDSDGSYREMLKSMRDLTEDSPDRDPVDLAGQLRNQDQRAR